MGKVTILTDLYKKSVQEYTRTPAEWKDLLSCVARYYKRSFDNTVLIYAQKPDATQLATFDEWHDKRIDRNINKNAKGIAVIDMTNPNASLKHLFDLMDTNGSPQSFKNVMAYHWELEEQYRPSLLIKFHEKYATPTSSMELCLYKLVQRRVREILPQYMANFKVQDENSILYDLPIEAVKAEFTDLMTDSVAYTVFQKCGLSAEIFEENAFANISHFNSLDLFMAMGSCTVSLARPILKEINQEIENIKIERSKIYENRTTIEPHLYRGGGRADVSQSANIGERGNGQNAGGQIRQDVEGIHDGEPPSPLVGISGTGQNQRGNPASGRGSGEPQGGTGSAVVTETADAGHRGHDGESRSHENADPHSGGNHNQRSGTESQITPPESHTEPPTDDKKPSVGGFFVLPPKTEIALRGKTENAEQVKQDVSFPYRLLGRLQADCDYFLGAGQRNEKHLWAGSTKAQIAKMRELYHSVSEKPEWLTEQDIERYEQQMTELQLKTSNIDQSILLAPLEQETAGVRLADRLSEEEISDLVDVVLCADDVTEFTLEWVSEICDFWNGGHKLSSKANVIKAFYCKLDDDYMTNTGEYLHITGTDEGLDFQVEGQSYSFAYKELAQKIDNLMLMGIYPFSSDESLLDDYAIPDEVEQMQGAVSGDEDEIDEPEPLPAYVADDIIFADLRYVLAILKDQSLSLYLQQSIQDYFQGEADTDFRTEYVRKCYGWGHREIKHTNTPIHARTSDDGMHIKVFGAEETFEIHLSWEQVTANITNLIEDGMYVNPNTPAPPTKQEVIDKILCKHTIYEGGKQHIYKAMLSFPAKNDRVALLKKEHGIGGVSGGLENGGHERINYNDKGFHIEYRHDGVEVDELLSWSMVESRISELIRQDKYLTADEIAKMDHAPVSVPVPDTGDNSKNEDFEPYGSEGQSADTIGLEPFTAVTPAVPVFKTEPPVEQLNLFQVFLTTPDTYEETGGEDSDSIITAAAANNEPLPFAKGDRIQYSGRVYEILEFMHGDKTVKIGDIEQLKGLNSFKITERVPLSSIMDCKVLQADYAEGELAHMLVTAAQIVNQSNIDHDRAIMNSFMDRAHGEGLNYRYSPDHHLYDGGPKTKCQNNIAAIRLLKELQSQHRMATAEEQITLAKFVGWGGLASALTPGKAGWERQHEEIKSLLSEDEFELAQQSTTTAYYTEQSIIGHIYKGLEQFGFRGGNILDPATGTGNFYSVLPESMKNSKLYGSELDSITGAIAQQLFPEASIEIKGFEATNHSDHFFDVAVGNIPFNNIRISDSRYDKYNFKIHDYFIAKTLDKVRPGGMIAFITTKGTLDKASSATRKYIAQRAELLGAIRLPNNAFKAVAGTEVTADILFLQKREREIAPDEENSLWLTVEENADGIPLNSYFIDHPEMVLGKMAYDASMYGSETTTACHPIEGDDLDERLERAVSYIDSEYTESTSEIKGEKEAQLLSIPADPNVRNFTYTTVDSELYYRENSRMYKQEITGKKAERIKGMVEISHAIRELIDFQTNPDYARQELPTAKYEYELQKHIDYLNYVYDGYVKQYGNLNSYGNVIAFTRDIGAPLLRSIETESKKQKGVWNKSAMFYRATIKPKNMPNAVFSAEEALKVSLNVKGKVDLAYMSWLYQTPESRKATPDEIIAELGEKIYQDPAEYMGNPHTGWVTADEYLSGHVKDKLTEAILKADEYPELFSQNVAALKLVQPTPLTPNEISFTLGSTWIPTEIYQQFMWDTFKTMEYNQSGGNAIVLEFSRYSGAYYIANKSGEKSSVSVNQAYGTGRLNAYDILETILNLRSVEVKDPVDYIDPNTGEEKTKYVLNKRETILAREKQAEIKMAFESWLFAEPQRGASLTKLYNDKFNNIRPRKYDGENLILPDMSENIKLRKHQRDVVAHGLYGDGNLLMAHEVGAGKTYAAIVTAYELKRLGKIHKPLFAVPNHLVGQWASSYMEIYPNANILVAEKKDFEKKNRRRFVSRIATGDYDAVIMAHSSFALIGLSKERQLAAMKAEINGITDAIAEQKSRDGKDWSLKQMKIFQSNLQFRYDRLFNAEKKDDNINFEELGVDALIVDEAHAYKNNFSYTKMRNVAGVSGVSSQRAMDMHMKCQYINEIGNGKGVIYLTGTPISNSMTELYVLQKTLQPKELEEHNLLMFDSWASTFGKVESSLEIKPEGNGYQMKNRFARFHNLPELMGMFNLIADIVTADMLDYLPIPKLKTGGVQVIKTASTPEQKRIVMELGERAEIIRDGKIDSSEDNFLKLTHEARLLSVDPRAIDPDLPDDPTTKLNVCANKVAEIYHETEENSLAQLIFCDQGTPKFDDSFNFYEATKAALIAQGVKPEDIAFIQDAKTDVQREKLFDKVRSGETRVLIGSSEKMGTGMNVQKKLIALHHLDVPWRPSDLTQRNGRILRQGNDNEEISIFNYITENTFDSYLWQILEQKQRYIAQIMTGRSSLRSCEDIDDTVLQYAEFKALATSNPKIKEKMETDNEINRLTVLKSSWQSQRNDLEYRTSKYYPSEIRNTTRRIDKITADLDTYKQNKPAEFMMRLDGRTHTERVKAAEHLQVLSRKVGWETGSSLAVGNYAGFSVALHRNMYAGLSLVLNGQYQYRTEMGESELGNITRLENLAERILTDKEEAEKALLSLNQQLADSLEESKKAFHNEERLAALQRKKVELDLELEFKDVGGDVIGDDSEDDDMDEEENQEPYTPAPATLNQKLYRKLYPIAQPVLDGNAYHMKLESDGFEDLVVENIGGGEYSIAHYYKQNGDAMRDPEITFTVDKANNSIHPTSFLQDNIGIFYETKSQPPGKVRDLEQFMSQWFSNIKNQGFEPAVISNYKDEDETEDEQKTDFER